MWSNQLITQKLFFTTKTRKCNISLLPSSSPLPWCFFDHFLVPSLNWTLALVQVDCIAMLITQYLDLNVTWIVYELLYQHPVVSETRCRLGLRQAETFPAQLESRWYKSMLPTFTHTHTHPFNGPLSGTTRVSKYQCISEISAYTRWYTRYQKGKTNLDFTKARDSEWQRHQLGHMQVCTSLQTDNHANIPPLGSPGKRAIKH